MLTDTLADLGKKVLHRHWGILQDLVLDKRVLVLAAERDTAVGARHMEGHCDDTVVYSTEGPEASGRALEDD